MSLRNWSELVLGHTLRLPRDHPDDPESSAGGTCQIQFRKPGELLKSIVTENVVGLRVRAILGIPAYTSCSCAGALSMLRCAGFHDARDL